MELEQKLSFVVLTTSGAPIRQLTISKRLLKLWTLLAIVCLFACSYVVYDYYVLKSSLPSVSRLKGQISNQKDAIVNQNRQIQSFAEEINSLKAKLVDLNQFEKKIRIIANIENSSEQEGLFGVGGSIPEDLNPQIELEKQHNSLVRGMHEQIEQLQAASDNQDKGLESLLKYLQEQRNLLASTPAIAPVDGWITSRFGYRISPFTGRREFHKGLDIASRRKSSIIAPADGVVTYVGPKGLLGNVITIDHGHGMVTRYGHLEKALKKPGDKVKRGEKIGLVGNTGRSTGSHVHYEVFLNGLPVNPEKYIIN